MNRDSFAPGEVYHIYNRGVDKRKIFINPKDRERFYQSMIVFNANDPVGSLYEHAFNLRLGRSKTNTKPLVDIISYCLNPNHYHLIVRQRSQNGISEFMKRLGGGYTMYFNARNKRSGALFQGRFKSVHITTNEQLIHVVSYVNLNWRVHRLGGSTSKSSWEEYISDAKGFCEKGIILKQFRSVHEYKKFAEETLDYFLEQKQLAKELKDFIFD